MKYLRYLARTWTDPYNERGQYHQSEQQYADKQKAIAFIQQAERGIVIDLLNNRKLIKVVPN